LPDWLIEQTTRGRPSSSGIVHWCIGCHFSISSIALQAPLSRDESDDRCMLPPVTREIEEPVRETVRREIGYSIK